MHASRLSRNILYARAASSSLMRWVITNEGSMSPRSMRASNFGIRRCTWVWPILSVRPLWNAAPSGILSRKPPYTPGIDTVPPFLHAWIAWRKAVIRSVARYVAVFALS
jgi:hypothetical protein